jgi:glutathione S-transferase
MAVVLRYFDAQGRAQALRHALHALSDAGLSFEDVRVTLATWPPLREDPSFGGWFASLPTLTWDTDTVSETLSIASYVARRSGQYDGLGAGEIAKLEAVVSCCYLDVVRCLADVVWAPILYPGVDVATTTPRQLRWSLGKLARLSALLPDGDGAAWLGGLRPTVADFFLAEAVEAMRHVLGPSWDAQLRDLVPRAFAHAERMRALPSLISAWETRPPRLTASPDEPAALERVRGCNLSNIGL